MASKDKRRRDRERQQQQRERGLSSQSPAANPAPLVIVPAPAPEKPTWEKRLEERALRERWPIPLEAKIEALARIMEVITDTGTGLDAPSPRDKIRAINTLLAADKINLQEQSVNEQTGDRNDDAPLDPETAARILAAAAPPAVEPPVD